ncbi:hypothetical protein JCM10213_003957 [Rhodosporidiobolus nylandii]
MRPKRRQPALRVVLLRKLTTGQMGEDSERESRIVNDTGNDKGGSASLHAKRLLPPASNESIRSIVMQDLATVNALEDDHLDLLIDGYANISVQDQHEKLKNTVLRVVKELANAQAQSVKAEAHVEVQDAHILHLEKRIRELEDYNRQLRSEWLEQSTELLAKVRMGERLRQ